MSSGLTVKGPMISDDYKQAMLPDQTGACLSEKSGAWKTKIALSTF